VVQNVKNPWSKVTVGNHENCRDRMNVTKPISKRQAYLKSGTKLFGGVQVLSYFGNTFHISLILEIISANFRKLRDNLKGRQI
jgi:hypothetical protein